MFHERSTKEINHLRIRPTIPEDVSLAVLAPDEGRVHLGQVHGEAEVADVPGRVLHEVVAVVDPILRHKSKTSNYKLTKC